MKKVYRVASVILAIIVVFSGWFIWTHSNKNGNMPESSDSSITPDLEKSSFKGTKLVSYEKVAQNEQFTMFADENGHFEIHVNKTGSVWYSSPQGESEDRITVGMNRQTIYSEVVVNYVYKDEAGGNTASYTEASLSGKTAIRDKSVFVQKISNGIKVVYDFYNISVRVTAVFQLENTGLSARIIGKETLEGEKFAKAVKNSSSKEQLESMQDSYITSIWLLPSFGAGTEKENGFVFIPDGNGAYMDYKPMNAPTETLNIPVYGTELAIDDGGFNKQLFSSETKEVKAYFPMFAVSRQNDGFFATIENGDAISSITAYKAGKACAYTGVSAQVDYRTVTFAQIGSRIVQGLSDIYKTFPNFAVEYHFISDDHITFATLSNLYREWLESNGNLKKQNYNSSLSLQVVGAINIDSHFLGIPCKRIKSLTTFEQCADIITALKKNGIHNVSLNYLGWNNNGLQNDKVIKVAQPINQLGGEKGLKALAKVLTSKDALYLDADIQIFENSGNGISKTNDSAKTPFDKVAKQRSFSYATFDFQKSNLRLLSPNKIQYVFERYLQSTRKLPKNVGLSFNSATAKCYSDFDTNAGKSRIDTVKLYRKMFEEVKIPISAYKANSYSWKYANRIYQVPNSSSRQKIYDGEVPFYQMLLHGYVALTSPAINQCGSHHSAFLCAVATGCELNFLIMQEESRLVNGTDFDYLYGTTYNGISQDIKEMIRDYLPIYEKISHETVKDYIVHTPLVTEMVYSNGIHVYVNYSNDDFVVDDTMKVPSNGFCYKEEK